MADLGQDYLEALSIIQGTSMMLPEVRHLKALDSYREDQLVKISLKVLKLHGEIMDL